MNTRVANPYVVGAPLSGDQGFYGREEVLNFVRETFAEPAQNVIVLYGQRRIGKTSLLHQLVKRAGDEFHAVLFDLQGKAQHDLPAMLRDLSAAIARSLNLPTPALQPAAVAALLPAVSDRPPADSFRDSFLPDVYAALGDKRLLLLFDEFDVLGDESSSSDALAGNELFTYLRDWLAHEPRLACLFVVGRRLDELPIHYRSLFKQAVFRRLSVLPRAEAVELITRPAAGALDYTPESIDAILDLTAGHPYFTQLVCHVILKRLTAAGRTAVAAQDVRDSLDEAMEIGSGGLDWFWEGVPRAERIILSALAETLRGMVSTNGEPRPSVSEETLFQTLNRYRVRLLGVELTTARQHLLEWEILARDGDRFRFVIDLVRLWIAREHPLDRAQQEIDLISQRATRYFNNARDAHLAGDLPLAIDDYRRALAANPNHFGARLGLAQALQETNDLAAAIAEYEKAYQIDPASARDGLLSAHLAMGIALQSQGDLDAAAAQFEAVLRLAPSEDEARARLLGIWTQRGEAELAAGRYAPAVDAFAHALDIAPDDETLHHKVKAAMRRFSESVEARGQWETAFESLSRLAEHLPEDEQLKAWLDETRLRWRAHNYYEMARKAHAVGDRQTTLEECRRALEANPNHAQARLLVASTLYQDGDWSGAIEEYELAYRLDAPAAGPGLAQARMQRAAERETQNDVLAAVADYERAVEVQPGAETPRRRLPEIWMRWGDDHLAAGRLDEAVELLRKALLLSAQPQTLVRPIKTKLAEFSQAQRVAGNWDVAIAALARLRTDLMLRDRETDGWLIDAWMQRGESALDAGQYSQAAAAFKQALHAVADTSDPASLVGRVKTSFFAHADACLHSGRPEAAITALTTLVEAIGSDTDTFNALAHAWVARGDVELQQDHLSDAETSYQRALELRPDDSEALVRLTAVAERRNHLTIERLRAQAAAHAARREWAEAEKVYRQLVFDYHDEASQQSFTGISDEIRLDELYLLAHSYHDRGEWNAAIPVWMDICRQRLNYAGRDGQQAVLRLAEAIERNAGVAQTREQLIARLTKRARLAWIVAAALGVAALAQLAALLAGGVLRLP